MTANQVKSRMRAAILGYGKMGQHHKAAIELTGFSDVVAVSDPFISGRLKDNLQNEGIAYYNTPKNLFAAIKPDVVHVCTPPETHAELAYMALASDSHIYIEKPFSPTVNEAASVLEMAKHTGRKACAGHQVLFEEMARKLPSMIAQIGSIVHVESYFSFRQVRKNLTPTEQMMDILPHPIYLLQAVLNHSRRTDEIVIEDPIVNAHGEVRCLLRCGSTTGMLCVTLRGRPVESYLKIIGDNGMIIADFVRNIALQLPGPGASAFDAIINPYWSAKQIVGNTTMAFFKRAIKKQRSYPGLFELINAFHRAIAQRTPSPVSPAAILQTVSLCERIGQKLIASHQAIELSAKNCLEMDQKVVGILNSTQKRVLVTGGTGFLGKKVVQQLVENEKPVRVVSRHLPMHTHRLPGVEYMQCDLGESIAPELMENVDAVIHCAAETAGGKEEHQKNSINATRNLIQAAVEAEIRKFIFVSSIAVLKSDRGVGAALNESSPVDYGNLTRGPYVWGKAESETICRKLSEDLNIDIKIIRPGPLVDFLNFSPPGRLGRCIGPIFVAVGKKSSPLGVCDITKAAKLIGHYTDAYNEMPCVLNLLDPVIPTRNQLIKRLVRQNPYLTVAWIPPIVLNALSPVLVALQKIILHKEDPIRIVDAFASEKYDTALAKKLYAETAQATAGDY